MNKTTTLVLEVDDKNAIKSVNNLENAFEKTTTAVKQTEDASEQLAKTLEKQEAKIKVIGGAINLLGGSVEVLVGGLALVGIPEESLKQFEAITLGAIAFADGTKRSFEGIKELNEGLKSYGGIAGAVREIQTKLNVAMLANPAGIYAVAIIAVGVALGGLIKYFSEVISYTDELNQNLAQNVKLTDAQQQGVATQTAKLEILGRVVRDETQDEQTRINALEELKRLIPELIDLDINRAGAIDEISIAIGREIVAIENRAKAGALEERLNKLYLDRANLIDQVNSKSQGLINTEDELRIYILQNRDAIVEGRTAFDKYVASIVQVDDNIRETSNSLLQFSDVVIPQSNKSTELAKVAFFNLSHTIFDTKTEVEVLLEAMGGYAKFIAGPLETSQATFRSQIDKNILKMREFTRTMEDETNREIPTLFKQYVNLISEIGKTAQEGQIEFFEGDLAKGISQSLALTSKFAQVLTDNIDDSTQDGFNKSKKAKIAQTRISSIEAAFSAYGSLIGVPVIGAILAPIASALALSVGQKAINDIKSSSFSSTGAPSNPGGGSSLPSVSGNSNQPQFRGQFLPITAPQQQPPIRAYVITGDVNNGQEALAQLQSRRRFG